MYIRCILLVLCISACNALFYYPDRYLYQDPSNHSTGVKEHRVDTPDAVLHALHFYHAGPQCRGLVVQFHGNAQNMTAHAALVSWLTQYGYDVLTFDYRGYGLSTGTPSRDGLVEDGARMLHFASKLAPSCPKTIIIGQSLGGAVSVPAIALAKVNIHALVLDSTFPSYRRIAREKLAQNWASWPFQWPLSFLVSDGYSLIDYLDQAPNRLLVMHGKNDRIIPIELGAEIYQKARSRCKDFWPLEDAGHIQGVLHKAVQKRLVDYLFHLDAPCPESQGKLS